MNARQRAERMGGVVTVVDEPASSAPASRRSDRPPTVVLDPGDLSMVEGRMLLVANGGGHLSQLVRLLPAAARPRPAAGLGDQRDPPVPHRARRRDGHLRAPAVAPRDVVDVAHCFGLARKMLRHRPPMVISTGSGIAPRLPAPAGGRRACPPTTSRAPPGRWDRP